MSILAGAIGLDPIKSSRACTDILLAQKIYGVDDLAVESLGEAALGASDTGSISLSRGQNFLIACDVRFDNRDELCKILGLGSLSEPKDDAKIVAAAWERWGKASLERIRGDYAIATYDRTNGALTFARDVTGQRPLFYKRAGTAIAFSSMPVGLRRMFVPSAVNLDLLAEYLEQRSEAQSESSFFEGIEKVRAGELLEFLNGTLRRRFHWSGSTGSASSPKSRTFVEEYRALLDSAVAVRIKGRSRPLASQLSSGWDSNAVTATAARLIGSTNDLIAYTAAPLKGTDVRLMRHRTSDESILAAETARMHGIRHVIIRENEPLLEIIERQSLLTQEPVLNVFNRAWWVEIQRRAAADGASTLLTGEMGNLTLNIGGIFVLQKLIRSGRWRTWWREANMLTKRRDVRWRGMFFNSFMPWMPQSAISSLKRLFLHMPNRGSWSFVRREWSERIRVASPPLIRLNLHDTLVQRLRLYDFGTQRKAALASSGIEELDPLSDRRIIEFALQLQPEHMLREGELRPLAREALRDRVPASILDAHVRGLQSADWYLRFSQQQARDMLETITPHAGVRELLDLEKMSRAIDQWPTRDFNSFDALMTYSNGLIGALGAGLFVASNASNR